MSDIFEHIESVVRGSEASLRELRQDRPVAFKHLIAAYSADRAYRSVGQFGYSMWPNFIQDGFHCPGCCADNFDSWSQRNACRFTCVDCGGLVNTGYGDLLTEREVDEMFENGLFTEPLGAKSTYFDLSYTKADGTVGRIHGWCHKTNNGKYRIHQTG